MQLLPLLRETEISSLATFLQVRILTRYQYQFHALTLIVCFTPPLVSELVVTYAIYIIKLQKEVPKASWLTSFLSEKWNLLYLRDTLGRLSPRNKDCSPTYYIFRWGPHWLKMRQKNVLASGIETISLKTSKINVLEIWKCASFLQQSSWKKIGGWVPNESVPPPNEGPYLMVGQPWRPKWCQFEQQQHYHHQ